MIYSYLISSGEAMKPDFARPSRIHECRMGSSAGKKKRRRQTRKLPMVHSDLHMDSYINQSIRARFFLGCSRACRTQSMRMRDIIFPDCPPTKTSAPKPIGF
ncbi:hypothetical protein OCU04_010565 [Sclerotinia nivalis]|uniref:Uncharacterized protein n=1 Tax=Sclerotinia nivalis TaxID=352851 RepID=A0A9X0ACG7_9HELO|nr:hypothetical protein OCU04_010565 [Sclerotinia nivalis]